MAPLFRSLDGRWLKGIDEGSDLFLGGCGAFAEGFPSMSLGGVGVNSRQPGRLWSVYTSLPSRPEQIYVPAMEASPMIKMSIASAQAVLVWRYVIQMRIEVDTIVPGQLRMKTNS